MDNTIQFEDIQANITVIGPIDNPPELVDNDWATNISNLKPTSDGLLLNVPGVPSVSYSRINYISVFEIFSEIANIQYIDIYISQYRFPFRVKMNQIVYSAFFPFPVTKLLEAFNLFVLNLIRRTGIIYTDQHTVDYLQKGLWKEFADAEDVKDHNWGIWSRIYDSGKQVCTHCKNYFWINLSVPQTTERTMCRKCLDKEKKLVDNVLISGYRDFLETSIRKITNEKISAIRSFENFLKGKSLNDVDPEEITRYLSSIELSAAADTQSSSREDVIRDFYEYCFSVGLLDKNPFEQDIS